MRQGAHADFFYVKPEDVQGEAIFIVDQEWRHLRVVHRARVGQRFFAVDGLGHCFACELVRFEPDRAEAKILQRWERCGEPRVHLTMAASPLRGERFDLLVEKCTELGVSRFILVRAARTQPWAPGRMPRWQRVALAAMKQCGRSVLPEVAQPVSFAQVVEAFPSSVFRLLAHEGEGAAPLMNLLKSLEQEQVPQAVVMVGPEGGFTPEEVQLAKRRGFVPVSLGTRRLRAETAAIVAAALVVAACG